MENSNSHTSRALFIKKHFGLMIIGVGVQMEKLSKRRVKSHSNGIGAGIRSGKVLAPDPVHRHGAHTASVAKVTWMRFHGLHWMKQCGKAGFGIACFTSFNQL